jgi:uncharacterized protein (DUF305 family)
MRKRLVQGVAVGLVLASNAACSQRRAVNHVYAVPSAHAEDQKSIHQPTAAQRALGIYQPYSDADIDFLTGMIPHHAQAVIMADWAPTHGAQA